MPFREGEGVLCFHGPMLYEAKVQGVDLRLDNETNESSVYYRVHYKGWNTKWDEHVPAERVLPLNEATKQQQIDLRKAHWKTPRAPEEKKRKERDADEPADPVRRVKDEMQRQTKRQRQAEEQRELRPAAFDDRPSLNLDIPEYLRYQLVDDWEAITKNMQLPKLPRETTAKDVLDRYRAEYERNPRLQHPAATLAEWLGGLQLFFDKSLGNYLLYRFEREQYLQIRLQYGDDHPMSEVYGAEHLLRLFVTLPDLVAGTRMDDASVEHLRELCSDILRWLAGNQSKYFLSPLEQYENSSSAYQNISRM